ncbi:MAG: hypothetical protein ACLSEV_06870 [Coprococcus sp.]
MPKKAMDILTESMFYVLMAFSKGAMCGIDVADYIEKKTSGRIKNRSGDSVHHTGKV